MQNMGKPFHPLNTCFLLSFITDVSIFNEDDLDDIDAMISFKPILIDSAGKTHTSFLKTAPMVNRLFNVSAVRRSIEGHNGLSFVISAMS
mgnify:CR=1 FL=1